MLRRADLPRWAGGRGPAIGPTMGPSLPGRCPLWGHHRYAASPVPFGSRSFIAMGWPAGHPIAGRPRRYASARPPMPLRRGGRSFAYRLIHSAGPMARRLPASGVPSRVCRLGCARSGRLVGGPPSASPALLALFGMAPPRAPGCGAPGPGAPPAAVGSRLPWAAFAAGGRRASLFLLLKTGCDLGWALGRGNPDHHGPVFTGP